MKPILNFLSHPVRLLASVIALTVVAVLAHLSHAPALAQNVLNLLPLSPVFLSINDKVSQTTSQNPSPALDQVRVAVNAIINDAVYAILNRPAWQVTAAAVAPPVCATATVTSQVKTTATTQLFVNGTVLSLSATDPLWTNAMLLAANAANLAAGSVRRYLLLWDGTSATTVMSCMSSNDVVIGSGTSAAALAACRFPSNPPLTKAIVGVLNIVNLTNPFIPGTTLLGAAGVTATYIDGPDANCFQASITTP
jgi:hypothetical protein